MKSIRDSAFFTIIPILICVSILTAAADWKNPVTWIPDRFKPSGNGGEEAWEKVLIWDDSIAQKRGIRVALMPAIENEQNVPIDRRMTLQMKGYMQQFCEDVITVLDIEDTDLRDRLDGVLNSYINQWKQQGRIDPRLVEPLLPDIAVDAVVLFERTIYDQAWRGDRKIFRVGLVGAAFGVDTGEAIFRGEVLEESPWSGMQNTISHVERQAIRSLLQQLHGRFVEISARIDAERQAALDAAMRARQEQEQERLQRLQIEEGEFRRLAAQAAGILMSSTEPPDLIAQIRDSRNAIAKGLETPCSTKTDEDVDALRKTASQLGILLTQHQKYEAEQERLSQLPPPDQPVVAPENLPGSEEPWTGGLLIDFSDILTPTATPTATPRDYVPPGAFDLPIRSRRTPLPSLHAQTPTPTPEQTPRAQPIEDATSTTRGVLPLSKSLNVPFPAAASMSAGTDSISRVTMPIITPPSDADLKEIDVLQKRIEVPEGGASLLEPMPSPPTYDLTPTMQVISPRGS
ncbi:MAG: hypothetical protein ABIH23_16675 [bacterium]